MAKVITFKIKVQNNGSHPYKIYFSGPKQSEGNGNIYRTYFGARWNGVWRTWGLNRSYNWSNRRSIRNANRYKKALKKAEKRNLTVI